MSNDTDTFVKEVDESLRQDRVQQAARRYGPFLIGSLALAFVGMIGWQMWSDNQEQARQRHAEVYSAAQELLLPNELGEMTPDRVERAKAEFSRLTETGPQQYRVLAHMQLALILQSQRDLDGALASFDAAAEMARDPLMRESAQLRAAYIAAEIKDFAEVRRRLAPLIESQTNISYLARELLGVEAWEAGDNELARETLQQIVLAFDAPPGARERAQSFLAVLGPAPEAAATNASPEGEKE